MALASHIKEYYVAITQCPQIIFNDMDNVHDIISEKAYAQYELNRV